MIKRSKQDWSVGKLVNVGFMKLTVVKAGIDIKDFMPDIYLLKNNKNEIYEFIPHNGLSKCKLVNGNVIGTYNYGLLVTLLLN